MKRILSDDNLSSGRYGQNQARTFQSFTGKIDGINQARMLLKVEVKVCGKMLPAKLGSSKVEKVRLIKDDGNDHS